MGTLKGDSYPQVKDSSLLNMPGQFDCRNLKVSTRRQTRNYQGHRNLAFE